jgi:acetolactate synthase-1/2/3 large subunit
MTGSALMTGGDAIVEALVANGVDTIFGLPGAQLYALFDALQRRSDHIATIGARHEQACGYMAFGYARSTGRPGVFTVVPGPGVLNAASAICTARGCCAPMLCITGQVPSQFLDRGRGHLHELPDQLGTLRTLVKWAARIERAADAPAIINEAFRQMLAGRPGPVAVEMAWDVIAGTEFVRPLPAAPAEPAPAPSPQEVEAAAQILLRAERPMIMVGSGAQHAPEEVLALAEALDAPVAGFRGGRGIVPEDHELGISSYAAYRMWPEVDALIGIGTRLELPYMRWTGMMTLVETPPPRPELIRIDIDPSEMRRLRPHAGVVADAKDGAAALLEAVRRLGRGPSGARAAIAAVKRAAADEVRTVRPHAQYLEVIRAALPRDGILVEELCQTGFTSEFAYPVLAPRTYISPGYQGTLGFGFMTGLGVKVAHPGRPVVSITGDGGFMFGVQELATAVQYGIGLVTLLFNNNAYGNVLRDQQTGFGGRIIGSALHNPDFPALAAAFGVAHARVDSPAALRPVLERAIGSAQPALIEVQIDPAEEVSPWPFILPSQRLP